jgi:chaperonin cofactor prefoldin
VTAHHPDQIPYRRIGTILVEWGLVTEQQLAQALAEQEQTGRLLGEILVSTYGVSRVDLADALAEQWQEANRAATAALETSVPGLPPSAAPSEQLAEADLRVLLDEAEAARAELTIRTEELSKRLETLETLVVGVSDALEELRTAAQRDGEAARGDSTGHRPRRPRTRRAT